VQDTGVPLPVEETGMSDISEVVEPQLEEEYEFVSQ